MIVDPASAVLSKSSYEKRVKLAAARDKYIKGRLQQIRAWYVVGWLFWVLLALATYWIYLQKPIYLNPQLLSAQIQIGKMPSSELAQLAALGGLLFWGMIALLAGFIFQIYAAMYSERRLIRWFETLHRDDIALLDAQEGHEPQDTTQ